MGDVVQALPARGRTLAVPLVAAVGGLSVSDDASEVVDREQET